MRNFLCLCIALFLVPPGQATRLQGGVAVHTGKVKLQKQQAQFAPVPKPVKLEVYIGVIISAIGVVSDTSSGMITYIDPASDLKDKAFLGDYLLSVAGLPVEQSMARLANFGNQDTIVIVRISHNGNIKAIKCRRHPIEWFSPGLAHGLRMMLRP